MAFSLWCVVCHVWFLAHGLCCVLEAVYDLVCCLWRVIYSVQFIVCSFLWHHIYYLLVLIHWMVLPLQTVCMPVTLSTARFYCRGRLQLLDIDSCAPWSLAWWMLVASCRHLLGKFFDGYKNMCFCIHTDTHACLSPGHRSCVICTWCATCRGHRCVFFVATACCFVHILLSMMSMWHLSPDSVGTFPRGRLWWCGVRSKAACGGHRFVWLLCR